MELSDFKSLQNEERVALKPVVDFLTVFITKRMASKGWRMGLHCEFVYQMNQMTF